MNVTEKDVLYLLGIVSACDRVVENIKCSFRLGKTPEQIYNEMDSISDLAWFFSSIGLAKDFTNHVNYYQDGELLPVGQASDIVTYTEEIYEEIRIWFRNNQSFCFETCGQGEDQRNVAIGYMMDACNDIARLRMDNHPDKDFILENFKPSWAIMSAWIFSFVDSMRRYDGYIREQT